MFVRVFCIGVLALFTSSLLLCAQNATSTDTFAKVTANAVVKRGVEFLKQDDAATLADQRAITEIPSPPFKEKVRGEYYMKRLQQLGLQNVRMDSIGNVIGERKGMAGSTGKAGKLVVAAHLDTVFPEGTDVKVREENGKLVAPGIGDDCRGLAALLSVVRAFNETGIKTVGDLVFVGNVGEEGLGDLRGVKALFRGMNNIDGFISIDGSDPEHLVYQATGSRRYELTYKGPGGHSWGAFGTPSAIHALGRAIAKIADVQPPTDAKTTFTVGTIRGGTSINTIAPTAMMQIDMRSNSAQSLASLEKTILGVCQQAAQEENKRWNADKIKLDIKLVGDRPAGQQPATLPIIQMARLSGKFLNVKEHDEPASSTDANLPISLGIPAITLGGGGHADGAHTLEETFDPKEAYIGTQRVFLTVLGLVGVDGVSQPVLEKLLSRK